MNSTTIDAAPQGRKTSTRSGLRSVVLGIALLALAACTLAPAYERPTAPVATEWPSGPANPATAGAAQPAALPPWRDFVLDEQLRRVIELALANNRDLMIAALNVEKFRAFYRIERGALLPRLDASAGASAQRVAESLSGTGSPEIRRQYSVGLGVTAYELDLFGRVRSLREAALETYFATAEAQRAAQVSLIAAVAESWLTLAADREQLALARQTLESRQASFALIQKRVDAGIASALDLHQAQTTVDTARLANARFTRLVARDENLLTLLVGAASFPAELLPAVLAAEPAFLAEVAPGLPAETLLARPDILAAEHRLKRANADIGAARAAFLPRITLTGSAGLASAQLGDLFNSGAGTWSFIPQLTVPLFDAGRNRANLEVARVEQKIGVAGYEKALQTAFREVADALAERGTLDEQLAAQQSLTAATAASLTIAQARYERGVDSYLTLLDAQRSLFAAQQELIAVRLLRLANRVVLYKALGGGAPVEPGR